MMAQLLTLLGIAISFLRLGIIALRRMMAESAALREIAVSFLRLGTTAFGGPAAHIAMMEEEFVRRRGWLSREEFLDMLGATNLIPGPNSTEMALHIGHQRGGWKGLVVGGVCFIIPAMLIVMAAAWAYVRFGSLPQFQGIMHGIKPVVVAIILQALWRLVPVAIKSGFLALVGSIAILATLLSAGPLTVLFGAGVITAATAWIERERHSETLAALPMPGWPGFVAMLKSAGAAAAIVPFSLLGLFLFFLKVGAVLYGSGYVLLAFLQTDLVDRLHWITQSQLSPRRRDRRGGRDDSDFRPGLHFRRRQPSVDSSHPALAYRRGVSRWRQCRLACTAGRRHNAARTGRFDRCYNCRNRRDQRCAIDLLANQLRVADFRGRDGRADPHAMAWLSMGPIDAHRRPKSICEARLDIVSQSHHWRGCREWMSATNVGCCLTPMTRVP